MAWFSAKLRFAILEETKGGHLLDDCIYVFRAKSFEDAMQRALDIGRSAETEYLNMYKRRVLWKFSEILTLDIIMSRKIDGAEVHSEFTKLRGKNIVPFDQSFSPENSKPDQTI